MKSKLKKPAVYISLSILAVCAVIAVLFFYPKTKAGEVALVTRGDITDEVFVTGTVQAARKVALSFDRGGTVTSLPFPVGTTVLAGTIIASLQNDSEYASVSESKALVAIQEANLAKIHQGTREEEIRLKEAEAHKAEVSLQNSRSKTFSVLADAYSAAEESLNRYADPLFSNDDTSAPRLTYGSGTQGAYDAEHKRESAGESVQNLQTALQSSREPELLLEEAGKDLRAIQDLFITLGLTLRDGSTLDATTLADYRARVTSARSALTSAITSVQEQQSTLRDDAAELDRVTRALELAKAGATKETIEGAEQELLQAQAKLRGMTAAVEKTLLRAPFSGQISSKHVEVGETIQTGQKIMDFLGASGFIIEASVPEADVTKLEKGALAEVTLDAYSDEIIFPARLTLIEPASTEIEGVPTYKTTFVFENQDPRLRSGLTANVTIKRLSKQNVLIVPARAITTEDGGPFVTRILPNGNTEKVSVKTGNRSGNREVEIIEGLEEGDRIMVPEVK